MQLDLLFVRFYIPFVRFGLTGLLCQIAAAIWRGHMPGALDSHLSGLLNSTEIDNIYGSITTAISYPTDGPVYAGIM